MYKGRRVIVVIPARGGSKGIPRKNLRLLNGKPLIYYTINLALKNELVDKVVVTTDDLEIANVSRRFGATIINREAHISSDNVTLDPVIYDAINRYEEKEKSKYDVVITVQPTSPLLKDETLSNAIRTLIDNDCDTVMSVCDDRHLAWGIDESGKFIPKYKERLNRQYLPKEYRETGAILATKRRFVSENSRFGKKIHLIEVDKKESIDIDTYEDWWIAERILKRKRIVIRTDATNEIGTGHVYRQLYLASRIMEHEVIFLMDNSKSLGIEIVKKNNYPIVTFEGECFEKISELKPDIVVNDILDTTLDYMEYFKEKNIYTINFEDLGEGAKIADIVFNALYDYKIPLKNIKMGYEYYVLRDEFKEFNKKQIKEKVEKILITFGGTDPNNYTEKILNLLSCYNESIYIDVILGLGYKEKEYIKNKYKDSRNIRVVDSVTNISDYMYDSDIVITSGGRTMYEVASLGIPCMVLCQNERELTHLFGNAGNGFLNLGLGKYLNDGIIKNNLIELINNHSMRVEMNERMCSINLENGFENIMAVVKKDYLYKCEGGKEC